VVDSDDTKILLTEGIQRAFHVLQKYQWFIFIFCFSAIVFSLFLTYVFSEKYVAQSTIFYQPAETSLLKQKSTESFGAPAPLASFKVIMQTLRDAVRTESVLRPVVEKLDLDQKIVKTYDSKFLRIYHESKDSLKKGGSNLWLIMKHGRIPEEDPTVSAMKGLSKNIEVLTSPRDSYMYVLTVKDKFPMRAAAIVDEVGLNLVNFLKDEQQKLIKNKMLHLQKELNTKEDKILALRQERRVIIESNNLVSIPAQTSRGLANLYDLQLKQIQINSQVSRQQQEIEAYDKNIQGRKITQSEDLAKMRSQKLFSKVELEGLLAESKFTSKKINELQADLDKMPFLQQEVNSIENKISSGIREYEILKDFHTELLAQTKTAQSGTRLLHKALVPSAPIQPIKIYHVGLTGMLGLIFSVGFVFVLDYLRSGSASISSGYLPFDSRSNRSPIQSTKELGFLLEKLAAKVAAQGGNVFLREKERFVLAKSLEPDAAHLPKAIAFPLSEDSVFGQVMASGRPMLVEDIQSRGDIKSSGWDGYNDNSFMVLPVPSESGEIVGVISLHNKTNPPFLNEDKNLGYELLSSGKIMTGPVSFRSRILCLFSIILAVVTLAGFTFYILRKIGY